MGRTVRQAYVPEVGRLMYTWADFREAASVMAEGRVRLRPLQGHHVDFERWAEGYALIDDSATGAMKVRVDIVPVPGLSPR